MKQTIRTVKGMRSLFGDAQSRKEHVIACCNKTAMRYGYKSCDFPILEFSDVFEKSLGQSTDIIGKEMYQFTDRNDDLLCLRPEGTAGVIRAGIEQGIFYQNHKRLSYCGPMFRREKPQKGRFRQFTQFGFEYVGSSQCQAEIELLMLTHELLQDLQIADKVSLHVNALGNKTQREALKTKIIKWISNCDVQLDDSDRNTLNNNPIRIFDSKNPILQYSLNEAPKIFDELTKNQLSNFSNITEQLARNNICYTHNKKLVRGLDYYSDFVFEWVLSDNTKSQSAIIAGGRYDYLLELMGGRPQPSVGCAIGIDRIIDTIQITINPPTSIYLIGLDHESLVWLANESIILREKFPNNAVILDNSCAPLKTQFRHAHDYEPCCYIIVGKTERERGEIMLKSSKTDSQNLPKNLYYKNLQAVINRHG